MPRLQNNFNTSIHGINNIMSDFKYICAHDNESGLIQKIKKLVFSQFMFQPFKKYSNKMSVLKNRLKLNR